MARSIVSPVDPTLLCNGLKFGELPVQRVASHGDQELGGSVHRAMVLPATSTGKHCEVRLHGVERLAFICREAKLAETKSTSCGR